MQEANVTDVRNYEFAVIHDEEDSEDIVDDEDEDAPSFSSCDEHIPFEPQAKRVRKCSTVRKTCAARGCHNSHFWSKKWVVCPKCKKNFCPKHAEKMHDHKC